MSEDELQELTAEMRKEFQIPPYYDDEQLVNLAKEGEAVIGGLNPGSSLATDNTYRMLLKNYMYYAYHHKVNEFMENYKSVILTWQMETEVDEDADA